MNYQGHAFHKQFEGGKTSGEIQFSTGRVSFSKDGQLYTSFVYKGLELERGGSANRLIYLKHNDHPDWTLYSSDESLLQDRNLQLNCPQYVSLLKKQKNIARLVLLASFAAFILFFIALEMILGITLYKEEDTNPMTASVFPLAFPLIAGPGSLTTLLSLRAEFETGNIIIAVLLNVLLIFIVLKTSSRIERLIGQNGISIIRKVFGVILLAIAIKLFATNVKILFT